MNSPISADRILVVDDNEDVLRAARLLLKQHFSSVETLNDPAQLSALATARTFDVLLLDMNFTPGADDGAEGLCALSDVLKIDNQAVVIPVGETIQRKADHFETLLGILKMMALAPNSNLPKSAFWRTRAEAAIAKAEAILAGARDPD